VRPILIATGLGGLLMLAGLVLALSPTAIAAALTTSAEPVLAASLYRIVPILSNALSWRALIPPESRPRTGTLLRLRWIGESVNALLPVAQVGGDLVRARLLNRAGAKGSHAAASMVADLAVGAASQVAFTVMGVVALVSSGAGALGGTRGQVGRAVALAAVLTAVGAGALLAVARIGIGRIITAVPFLRRGSAATGADGEGSLAERAASIDHAFRAVLARRGQLLRAFAWHLGGWVSQVGETWLILQLLRSSVSFSAALAIETLAATARSAAFLVPGGLGVQEGALVLAASHFGVDGPHALALGIVKRMREVITGAPGILAWVVSERRALDRFLRRRRPRRADGMETTTAKTPERAP
jgi:putative membrane protein